MTEYRIKKKFNIDIAIIATVLFQNNRITEATKYIQFEIKDTTDVELIEEVNNNILKSMQRKILFEENINDESYLLINENFKLYGNNIKNRNNNKIKEN